MMEQLKEMMHDGGLPDSAMSLNETTNEMNVIELDLAGEETCYTIEQEESQIEIELTNVQSSIINKEGAAADDFVGSVIELKSSDEESFKITGEVACVSETIMKKLIDAAADSFFISLSDVTGKILGKVIDYMKFIVEAEEEMADVDDEEALNAFDKKFIGAVDPDTLFDLMRAAYYLKVEKLLDLTCRTVADRISGMTTEQIREAFDIVNDFTEKEEEQARKGIAWAFQ